MNFVDEFTARRWVRAERKCPMRDEAKGCEHRLALRRTGGCECLWCPRHGQVFGVDKAA